VYTCASPTDILARKSARRAKVRRQVSRLVASWTPQEFGVRVDSVEFKLICCCGLFYGNLGEALMSLSEVMSMQTTVTHDQCDARDMTTFRVAECHRRPLISIRLYCSVSGTWGVNNLSKVAIQQCPDPQHLNAEPLSHYTGSVVVDPDAFRTLWAARYHRLFVVCHRLRCLVVGLSRWLDRWPGTHNQTLCMIRHVCLTVSGVIWKFLHVFSLQLCAI